MLDRNRGHLGLNTSLSTLQRPRASRPSPRSGLSLAHAGSQTVHPEACFCLCGAAPSPAGRDWGWPRGGGMHCLQHGAAA